jgi:uncharacterized protein (DUF1015 family)
LNFRQQKEINYLWKIDDLTEINGSYFSEIDSLYIADGHHRSEAARLLSEENPVRTKRIY